MKILVVCLIVHHLRVAEPSPRYRRWPEQRTNRREPFATITLTNQPADPKTAQLLGLLNDRWTWSSNIDHPLHFLFESFFKRRRNDSHGDYDADVVAGADYDADTSVDANSLSKRFDSARIRVSARSACSCESQNELRDLGEGHYPRYLTASRCKSQTCQSKFHSCKLLQYMVYILRLREANTLSKDWYLANSTLPETPLPESLSHKWQLKPVLVTVACVPMPDARRN